MSGDIVRVYQACPGVSVPLSLHFARTFVTLARSHRQGPLQPQPGTSATVAVTVSGMLGFVGMSGDIVRYIQAYGLVTLELSMSMRMQPICKVYIHT
jgi:hypothetical protein